MSEKPMAWVTGAAGLIGSNLVQTARLHAPQFEVSGLTREQLDLTNPDAIWQRFQAVRPQLIVHCAALSQSAGCQKNPPLAWKINVEATQILAQLAAEIPFLFLSSDLVFDGRKGHYDETATVHPLTVYGQTKAAAEEIVLANPRHSVVRTSLNGGTSPRGDRGFNEQLRRAWQAGQIVKLFRDEFRSPIAAAVTAQALWELAAKDRPGLYHVAGTERLSRWQIGQLIAARWPLLTPRIEPCSLRDYPGPPRSPDTSLNCGKVQQLLSFPLPGLSQWLKEHPHEPF